jgi:CHAT domain-containing protein
MQMQKGDAKELTRLWWCPTGPLLHLPIHAAGIYRGDETRRVSLSDFVISSYAPVLSLMLPIWSRAELQDFTLLRNPHVLSIGQTDAVGMSALPGVTRELQAIERLSTAHEANFSLLEGPAAHSETVLQSLDSAEIVHFACHGEQGTGRGKIGSFQSALILADGRMDITRLIRKRLPKTRLAFLSACQTARGDTDTPDESTHIAAAMLFTGCQSVVGTQWSISDTDGPIVAQDFYSYLFREGDGGMDTKKAALALHLAVQKLRESGVSFARWVPFIHMGI